MKYLVVFFTFLLILGCGDDSSQEVVLPNGDPEIEALAPIYSITESSVQDPSSNYLNYDITTDSIGYGYLYQIENVVFLELSLFKQVPNGSQAVHIHNGTLGNPLRHWSQESTIPFCNVESLGEIWAKPFAGDVGNISIDENGNGKLTLQTDLWALNSGDEKDILDKVIIIHQSSQDFLEECSPNHKHDHTHSNQKIGGGTITLTTDVERVVSASRSVIDTDVKICN